MAKNDSPSPREFFHELINLQKESTNNVAKMAEANMAQAKALESVREELESTRELLQSRLWWIAVVGFVIAALTLGVKGVEKLVGLF